MAHIVREMARTTPKRTLEGARSNVGHGWDDAFAPTAAIRIRAERIPNGRLPRLTKLARSPASHAAHACGQGEALILLPKSEVATGSLGVAVAPLASIYDLVPTEEGGSVARAGFNYQDHIAARFCIAMLGDGDLSEVWCETEDDVTLIWKNDGAVTVEFVQVKAHELAQLWSIALLCAGSPNDSIISKSLAHDRCTEPCCFRIVSRTEIHPDLHSLRLDRSHADRCLSNPAIRKLHSAVSAGMQSVVSERGRSASNWLAEAMWEVCESEQAIIAQNRWCLQEHLEYRQQALFTDQLRELYDQVLFRVQQASLRKWRGGADAKKFTNQEFETWLLDKVHQIKGHAPTKAGLNLRRKMSEALLPESAIENADDLRRAYRGRMLDPKYQQDSGLRDAELEVAATLQHLLSDLDAGNLIDNGLQFHARCLGALPGIRAVHPTTDLNFLQGVLYAATDRCRHRFVRATP